MHSFKFKLFQREDLARLALCAGGILGWATGIGKTIAMFIWPLLKVGYLPPSTINYQLSTGRNGLRPAKPTLLVVPADGHDQTDDESLLHFKTRAVRMESQEAFLKLSKPDPRTGRRTLPPHYYMTSYQQLSQNGVRPFPELDRSHPERMMELFTLKEADVIDWYDHRGDHYGASYERLNATVHMTMPEIEKQYAIARREVRDANLLARLSDAFYTLKMITPLNSKLSTLNYDSLAVDQKKYLRSDLVLSKYKEYSANIGGIRRLSNPELPTPIKCIYSATLADLSQDCFDVVIVDEGTKIKAEDSLISLGCRQISAEHRLVMTATPIKNRFPDIFRLAHYTCGGHEEPTARFPYGDADRDDFAEEFMVSERNLTKEEETGNRRKKLTPQVCNVHKAWKLLAPIVLRRRKQDCGEDIVPKRRNVVRVPMGLYQAAVYKFHLEAKYRDRNGRKANGPQLTALRVAAANPASALLVRPDGDTETDGNPSSRYVYIPKVATALSLIEQVLLRHEQVILFGSFNDSLDVIGARLAEAGIPFLTLDGRTTPKKRGMLARQFKPGPPKAVIEGYSKSPSRYPIVLAGIESMAELHSFHLCNNVILTSYSWAFDKFEQAINRAHRINSWWPVDVWSIICDGSADRILEANIHEKGDATELVLDGHLLGEESQEINLAEILEIARKEFRDVKTMDERDLTDDWPKLRARLGKAWLNWHYSSPAQSDDLSDLPLWRRRRLARDK